MPLIKRSSKAARATNIRRLIDEGYPPRQAVAIAYSTQRAAAAHNRAGKRRNRAGGLPAGVRRAGRVYVFEGRDLPEESTGILATFPTERQAVASASGRDGFGGFVWHQNTPSGSRWHVVEGDLHGVPINRAGGKRSIEQLVAALRANADSYHHGKIDHLAFSSRNRELWRRIEEQGAAAQDRALAMLRNRAGRRSPEDRLFVGVYPGGIVYADKSKTEHGDYKRVGFLPYDTLELQIAPDAPRSLVSLVKAYAAKVQAHKGQPYQISATGQTVTLGGGNRAGGKRRNRAGDIDADTLARVYRNGRKSMSDQFDRWVSDGLLADPNERKAVVADLVRQQKYRTKEAYERYTRSMGEREAAFRQGIGDEAYDLLNDVLKGGSR